MDCASCAAKIHTAVRRLDGVADVSVSVTGASMTVSHGGSLNDDKVLRQVARLGYGIVKAEVFGFVVVLVSCNIGLRTRGGPREIGASVTKAVVVSLILILVLDYFLTKFLM